MPVNDSFPIVFEQLKSILKPYAKNLTVTADTSGAYSLDGPYSEKWKKPVFFRGRANQEELRQFLFDAGLYVSRTIEKYLAGIKEAHARKILFQLQESGARVIQGVGRPGKDGSRKIQKGKLNKKNGQAKPVRFDS